jgi:hypothetical protein
VRERVEPPGRRACHPAAGAGLNNIDIDASLGAVHNANTRPDRRARSRRIGTAAATPARKALDAAGADDIERRLETLKRLRDKGLISEDDYQKKRQEILQLL